jgi:hypothetical protein
MANARSLENLRPASFYIPAYGASLSMGRPSPEGILSMLTPVFGASNALGTHKVSSGNRQHRRATRHD